MALWPVRAVEAVELAQSSPISASAPASTANLYPITPEAFQFLAENVPVTRREAYAIPACARAVDLLAGTTAALPLERRSDAGRLPLGWVDQPEGDRPRYNTLIDTCHDLIFNGVSYWWVKQRDAQGAPRQGWCEYVSLDRINILDDGTVIIDEQTVSQRDVIGFQGWHDGILNHGGRTLRQAGALELAAKRYADTPVPAMMLKNTSTYELNEQEISDLLEGVRVARQSSSIGYLNAGVDISTLGYDAQQAQLVESRQFVNAQIANLCGVPSGLIAAASAAGASLTYQNIEQDNRAFVDFGLTPLLKSIEGRLSLEDRLGSAWRTQVTPRGNVIRFNVNGLLRGNPEQRAHIYSQLVPLGILTVDEARAMEDLSPSQQEGTVQQ